MEASHCSLLLLTCSVGRDGLLVSMSGQHPQTSVIPSTLFCICFLKRQRMWEWYVEGELWKSTFCCFWYGSGDTRGERGEYHCRTSLVRHPSLASCVKAEKALVTFEKGLAILNWVVNLGLGTTVLKKIHTQQILELKTVMYLLSGNLSSWSHLLMLDET